MGMQTALAVRDLAATFLVVSTPAGHYRRHVIDMLGRLHHGLTVALEFLENQFSPETARKYASIQRIWIAYLDAIGAVPQANPAALLPEFLIDVYGCRVRKLGNQVWQASSVNNAPSTIRSVIAAVLAYYDAQIDYGLLVANHNPLRQLDLILKPFGPYGRPVPVRPACVVVRGGPWRPHFHFDPDLHSKMLAASAGWPLWAQGILRALFDSGARVHEVCDLTMADWARGSFGTTAEARSKGSRGRRVKWLALSPATQTLWQRYIDSERCRFAPGGAKLADYMAAARNDSAPSMLEEPLFMRRDGQARLPNTFRDTYWTPAATALGLKIGPHGARHWFVTRRAVLIDRTSRSEAEWLRRRHELAAYMHWVNGHDMLALYDHTLGLRETLAANSGAEFVQSEGLRAIDAPEIRALLGSVPAPG